eukprot:m.291739 g.291739  ORF g.291739 m.291739 type:complete len:244 (+) comp19479_c0_seq5:123-854(+)
MISTPPPCFLSVNPAVLVFWGVFFGFFCRDNRNGQLGLGELRSAQVPERVLMPAKAVTTTIACGNSHAVAATDRFGVYCWGLGEPCLQAQDVCKPTRIATLAQADASRLACGERHSLAVVKGAVYAWGDNSRGQLGLGHTDPVNVPRKLPSFGTRVAAVGAGAEMSCALGNDGQLWSWGGNTSSCVSGEHAEQHNVCKPAPVACPGAARALYCASWNIVVAVDGSQGTIPWSRHECLFIGVHA